MFTPRRQRERILHTPVSDALDFTFDNYSLQIHVHHDGPCSCQTWHKTHRTSVSACSFPTRSSAACHSIDSATTVFGFRSSESSGSTALTSLSSYSPPPSPLTILDDNDSEDVPFPPTYRAIWAQVIPSGPHLSIVVVRRPLSFIRPHTLIELAYATSRRPSSMRGRVLEVTRKGTFWIHFRLEREDWKEGEERQIELVVPAQWTHIPFRHRIAAAVRLVPRHDIYPPFDPRKRVQVDKIRHEPLPEALLDRSEEEQERYRQSRCEREVSMGMRAYVF
ncbi:hypothetical protein DENSPDRAFT_407062 [Dentipellis sp. KUC8613]|nr:hypothetical protein DENSPDRAFT_407062 [Dentipellis sp. KUC8613]